MAARQLMEPHLHHLSKELIIRNELGLHARPAGRIAKIAGNAKSRVWLEKDGEAADASSIIDLLSMGCVSGSKIIIRVEDGLDVGILNSIADLIESGFGE
jgi:phosphotransferase system HPr (HPr) family protein